MTGDFQYIMNSVFRKQKASIEALLTILFKIKRVSECIILKKPRSFDSPQLNGVFWKGSVIVKKNFFFKLNQF